MKKYIPVILVLLLGIGLFFGLKFGDKKSETAKPFARTSDTFPIYNVTTITGENIKSSDLIKADYFLLNVWATWCIACYEEHPLLLDIANSGVRIVGLNYMDVKTKANDWLQKLGNPYTEVIYDPTGRFGIELGVTGAPETYLVSPKGKILHKLIGVLNNKTWQQFCNVLAKEQPPVKIIVNC